MQEFITYVIDLVKAQINTNQFLSGGLILGLMTSVLYSLRSIPSRIWNRIERRIKFVVTIEQTDDLYAYLQFWLNHHYAQQLRSVKANFWRVKESNGKNEISSGYAHEKKTALLENQVAFNHYGDTFIVWYSKRLIRISSKKDKLENASNPLSLFFEQYEISGLWSKVAIKKLLDEAVKFSLSLESERTQPYVRVNEYDNWSTDRQARLRDIEKIFIPYEQKNVIIEDLKSFVENKDFYRTRCLPYRRGYLLHGLPGTGKSSFVSALAKMFKKDLYILNLKACGSDNTFIRLMSYLMPNSILLIEDIDSYFDGRKNESASDKVNFSTFINVISGVNSKEDVILFITTNHKNKLDEAMLRSGRLDVHMEIGLPTAKEVNGYLSWFYDTPIDAISGPVDYTMADVENICVQNKTNASAALYAIQSKPKLAVNA